MSSTDKSPPRGYSYTDAATASKGETKNIRRRNHNGSRRKNQLGNRSLANFTGKVPSVGSILGTVSEQRSMKDQFKTFQDKLKQYLLHKFDNPKDVIIVIRSLKDPYAQIEMSKTITLSKEDKEYVMLITQLQEKGKYYMKRV